MRSGLPKDRTKGLFLWFGFNKGNYAITLFPLSPFAK
jgi:hypothetical protein